MRAHLYILFYSPSRTLLPLMNLTPPCSPSCTLLPLMHLTPPCSTLLHLKKGARTACIILLTANAFGVSRQTVSKIVRKVCNAITVHLGPKYIILPFTEEAVQEKVESFYSAYGFPQCLGAIDGTHIPIN